MAEALDRNEPSRPILESFSRDRPLLLLTDYPPEFSGGGAVILKSLLGPEDYPRLIWLTLSKTSMSGSEAPRVVSLISPSLPRSLRGSVWLNSTLFAEQLAAKVMSIAREHHAAGLWSVLHNATVPITAAVARRGLPVHATVHDDPAFATAVRSRRYAALAPWLEFSLRRALRTARSTDVIGEGMAQRYRRRFGVEAAIVHRAMAHGIEPSPTYDRERHGLRTAVLGNTYGYPQLRVLARAIADAGSQLGVRTTLTFIGAGFGERLKRERIGPTIETLGHLSEVEAVEVLRSCYLQYLNYPFSALSRVLRQTSFPTKLTTYLQSARPLLLHMPSDASAAPLAEHTRLAVSWRNMSSESGAETIISAWREDVLARSVHEPAEVVRSTYFDATKHRNTLRTALSELVT